MHCMIDEGCLTCFTPTVRESFDFFSSSEGCRIILLWSYLCSIYQLYFSFFMFFFLSAKGMFFAKEKGKRVLQLSSTLVVGIHNNKYSSHFVPTTGASEGAMRWAVLKSTGCTSARRPYLVVACSWASILRSKQTKPI